jgi:hypothetical protein
MPSDRPGLRVFHLEQVSPICRLGESSPAFGVAFFRVESRAVSGTFIFEGISVLPQ